VTTAAIREWKKCDRIERTVYIMAIYLLYFYGIFSMLFALKYMEMCDYIELVAKIYKKYKIKKFYINI
jgi:hypothetical protein